MIELDSIIKQRFNEVDNQFLNDDKIYANFQKALLNQVKMKGIKDYSDKRFDDFDILVWPKVKNLRDYRNILISKTGYQMDEENIKSEVDRMEKPMKFQVDPMTGQPIKDEFQAYSSVISTIRKKKHEKCFKDSPTYYFKRNPQKPMAKDMATSPTKPQSPKKQAAQVSTANIHLNIVENIKQYSINQSQQDETPFTITGDQTVRHTTRNQSQHESQAKLSNKEFNSPDHHDKQETIKKSKEAKKKRQRKRKASISQHDEDEEEEDPETVRKREQEQAEHSEEEKQFQKQLILESIQKQPEKMVGQLQSRMKEITQDIERFENYSDDEYDIFENHITKNSYANAKLKVQQKALIDKNRKLGDSGSKTQKEEIKIQEIVTESAQTQQAPESVDRSPTFKLTTIPIPISKSPQPISQPFSVDQTYPHSPHAQSVQSELKDRMQKSVKKMENKQNFAQLMAEVYEKNEDIDYGAKSKRKLKQLKRHQARENGEESMSHEAEEGDSPGYGKSSSDSELDRQMMIDQFKKEEERENEMIKKKLIEEQKKNMQRKYLQMCKNEKVVPLPIVNKIIDGVLDLNDYKLNFGLCKALGNVLDDLGDTIHKIDLKNNGITDSDYAEVVKGALQNPHIKSLSLRNNEFRTESLNQIIKYFEMKPPVLEELILVATKTKQSQMTQLLEKLSGYSNLRQLALCQIKLDKQCLSLVADIANANPALRDLDLSWNQTTALNMCELMQNIEYCRNISYLNLSFNSFVCSKTDEIVQSLCNFIKINRKLQHLDLSYCGLRKDEVFEIVKSCKKSRTLLSIHLSGNLITEETRQKIREFMRPRKRIRDMYENINDPDANEIGKPTFKLGNIDLAAAITAKLKQYQEGKDDDEQEEELPKTLKEGNGPKTSPGEAFIFQRILGHFEIPHSYKWQESSTCWICERCRYTVILMSKKIADTFFIQPKKKEKQNFLDKIKQAEERREESPSRAGDFHAYGSDDDEIYYDADGEEERSQYWRNNQIAGTFSRWKTQNLVPLGEFMRRLKKNQQDPVTIVQIEKSQYEKQVEEHRERQKQKDEQRMTFKRKQATMFKKKRLRLDDNEHQRPDWAYKMTEVDYEHVRGTWMYELQQMVPYKNTLNMVIGIEKLYELNSQDQIFSQLKEKVYVYADFMPPGKHNTCLLYNTPNAPLKGMYTFLVNVRHRELPIELLSKKVKEYRIQRKFDKPTSMFKDFPEDSPAYLKKMFLKDIESWKLNRVIKDGFELRNMIDTITQYIEPIKDVFNYCIAISSFPSISWIDFGNFCNQWKIPDNRTCSMTTIDRVFIATNVELVEQEDNPDRDLCRFEFFEIITRLGAAKYKDSGQVTTWDAAVKAILTKNILPLTDVMGGGQSFRDKYIWNLPIDDLFRANIEGVTKLYNKHSVDQKKDLNMEGCIEMVDDLQLPENEIKIAYSFSKMTIMDEMNQKDRYDRMLLPEFMDFLCRCAFFKYKEMPSISFLEKVERVLDIMLKQVEKRRERPNFEIDVSSDSDYESDD